MNQVIKLLITISLFFSSIYLSADLQDALQAYETQNYESAQKQFLELAKVGNADAFYNLGVMYYKGQFFEKNYQKAYAWMKLANKVDDFFETSIVEKKMNEQELVLAEQQFKVLNDQVGVKVFEFNYLPVFNFDDEFVQGSTTPKPIVKVSPIYPKRAVTRGVAGRVLISFRIESDGRVSDIDTISEYPEGYGFANIAMQATNKFKYQPWDKSIDGEKEYYYTTNDFKYDIKMSIQQKDKFDELVILANENNANAQFALSNYISPIYGVISKPWPAVHNKRHKFEIPVMKNQGYQLLLNSAINGNVDAQAYLGMKLITGRDVKLDERKGLNWLKRAASNGSLYAEKQILRIESVN